MRRLLVFALILSLGHAPAAVAGETLLQSGQRIARRQAADARKAPSPHSLAAKRLNADSAGRAALQAQTTLSQSGMRKRTKFLIALGIAGVFAGVAYAIDHGVEDSTPSSLGER